MNSGKRFFEKSWIYIVAFMAPWGIAILHSLMGNGWLSGEGSILRGDAFTQFVPFYYGLWDKIHLGESLNYTWNVGGGCDFIVILGYLISPFSLFVLLASRDNIAIMVQIITILKWALISVSMTYFFYHTKHNTLTEHKKEVSLFLGLAFSLSNGLINFVGYIQFDDVLICFPFLLLLVEKMVKTGKWKLYYLLMVFCMFSNLYLMFGISIFLFLWFFLQLDNNVSEKGKKFLIFIGSSLLAAVTNMYTVINNFVLAGDRLESQNMEERMAYVKTMLIKPKDFIKQMFILKPISDTASYDPNVFFSIMGIFLVVLFLFIRVGKKKYQLAIAALMIASFFSGALNLIWHLFNIPNAVNHRFIHIYIFVMLFLALQVMIHLREIRIWHGGVAGLILTGLFVYTFFQLKLFEDMIVYLATIMLIVLYVMLFILYCRKSITYSNMLLVIVIFGCLELTVNGYHAFTEEYDLMAFWAEDSGAMIRELSDEIPVLEEGERVNYVDAGANMGLVFNRPTDGIFVSSINGNNRILHDRLGMVSMGKVSYYPVGASPLVNLIFNTRYGIGNSDMEFSDAEVVDEKGEYKLYRMERLAGLGYMVDNTVEEWDISYGTVFDVQNAFVHHTVGGDDIFTPVAPEISCQTLLGDDAEDLTDDDTKQQHGQYFYRYKQKYGSEYDSMLAGFTVEEDMDLYVHIGISDKSLIAVFADGEMIHKDISLRQNQTLHIGKVKKGQNLSICSMPVYPEPDYSANLLLQFAKFNDDSYAKAYDKLSQNTYHVEGQESDYIKGSIHADEDGIMMTSIQAVDGFTVYVDGIETEYKTIGNAMIGVPLKAGDHVVEFRFHRERSMVGCAVSAGGAIIFVILCLAGGKKKKNMPETSEDTITDTDLDLEESTEEKQKSDLTEDMEDEEGTETTENSEKEEPTDLPETSAEDTVAENMDSLKKDKEETEGETDGDIS